MTTMALADRPNIARSLARGAFAGALALTAIVFSFGVRPLWDEASTIGAQPSHLFGPGSYSLSAAEADALRDLGLGPRWHAGLVVVRAVLLVGAAVLIGALLWLRSHRWPALCVAAFVVGEQFLMSHDGLLHDEPAVVRAGADALVLVAAISAVALLVAFPDRRSAVWERILVVVTLVVVVALRAADVDLAGTLWKDGLAAPVLLLIAGMLVRVAMAVGTSGAGRGPLVALAGGLVASAVVLVAADRLAGGDQPGGGLGSLARRLAVETVVLLLPLLVGVGFLYLVVRSGAWELDLSLNRAFVYTTLTALLVAVYFLAVALVQALVNDAAGTEESTVAAVVSTGVIALLALPAREWMQRVIDRMFFRRRYDLERTVESFEARIRDRDRLELVGADLVAAACDAFQPERAILWVPRVRP
jgi:hypothetical protein